MSLLVLKPPSHVTVLVFFLLTQTVLSGLVAPGTLSVRLVVAKLVGLTLALVAGLSVGKEVSSTPIHA